MAASVVQIAQKAWAGGYPLNFTQAITTTAAADGVVVFFATHGTYSYTPTATLGGVNGTLVKSSTAANGGTLWTFFFSGAFPAGAYTLAVSVANQYVDVGQCFTAFLTGTNGVGTSDTEGGGTSMSLSVITTDANSLVISGVFGYYTGGTLTQSSQTPAGTRLDSSTQLDSNQVAYVESQPGGGTVTSSWTVPYNQVIGTAIEVKGATGGGGTTPPAPSTSTGTETAGLKVMSAESGKVAVTGVQASNLSLTSTEAGTTAVVPVSTGASTGNLALTSTEAGTVATAPTIDESLPLALADAGTRYSIARTGAATYRDANGTLQLVAADGARLESRQKVPLGVMAEPGTVNLVADSMASAAVAGGSFPAHGSFYNGGMAGFTCTVSGTGVEDGIEYVDLRFQGTNSTGGVAYPSYQITSPLDCPTAAGDQWVLSAYLRIAAGTYLRSADSYPMVALGVNTYDSTGASYVASLALNPPILDTDRLTRDWLSTSVPSGSSVTAAPLLALNIPAGAVVDFTVRLGLPQMEKGVTRPTTAVKTNGTAGVARGAETLSYLTASGTKDIQVEYVGITGLYQTITYPAQAVAGGAWPVPAVTDAPFVRRISSSVTLAGRASAVSSATAKGWNLGVAFKLSDYTAHSDYATLIKNNAAIYAPEYEFKMDQIQPTEGSFSYTVADNFAAQATADNKKLRGHTLIWYAATPSWANSALTGSPTTARWQGVIDSHIGAVVNRWTQVTTWDVVNEAFEPADGISGGYRNSAWYQGAGSAYLAYAFQRARAYNTTAKLHLAEYGCEENDPIGAARRTAVLNWLTSAVQAGVPVQGLSLQCHLDIERPFSASVYTSWLNQVKALGLDIIVTEMDVRAPVNYNTIGYDLKAAERVRAVLDCITAVTHGNEIVFWDLDDTYTWLTAQFPARTERPLPYNNNVPKALYAALQQEFESVAPAAYSGTAPATSTGTSTAALALRGTEAGAVQATGTSTAGLKVTAIDAGTVAVTGTSTASFKLTAADAGTVSITGTSAGNLVIPNGGEAGAVTVTGSSSTNDALTASQAATAAATGTSTAALSLTDAGEAGTVAVTASQTAALALTSADAGTVAVTGTQSANDALSAVQAGGLLATGSSTSSLTLTSSESSAASSNGSSTGNFSLTNGSAAGVAQATGSSSSNLSIAASATGTEPAIGASSGSFTFTSSEQATGQYVSTGTMSSSFAFTSAESGAVAVAGTSTASLAATAASSGTAPATGASTGSLLTTSGEAGTVTASGQQLATLALTAPQQQFGAVSITGQQNANDALTASQSGIASATGVAASALAVSSAEAASNAVTGVQAATLLFTNAGSGSVSITGSSNAGATLSSIESGSAPATGTTTGGLSLKSIQAGGAVATGAGVSSLTLTSVDAGSVLVTGSASTTFAATAAETGGVVMGGQSTATISFTSQDTSGASDNGYSTGGMNVTGQGSGTVSDAGVQTSLLALTGSGTGTLAANGACMGGFVLTSSQSGALAVTGTCTVLLALSATENASALALSFGNLVSAFALSSADTGSLGIVGSSAAGMQMTAVDAGSVAVQGSGSGGFALRSVENVTAVPITQGVGAGGFVFTSADTAAIGVSGSGSGGFAFHGNEAAQAPESGVCVGGFVFTAVQAGQETITGVQAATIALTGVEAATVSLTGQGAASLGLSSQEAGGVQANGQGSGSITVTAAEAGVQLAPIGGTTSATIAISGSGQGGVLALGELAPAAFRFGQVQTAQNPVAGVQQAAWGIYSADLGVVLMVGQGSGSWLLRAVEWSRQENPGVMLAGLSLSSRLRGVLVTPQEAVVVSGRKAIVGGGPPRIAVAPRVGGAIGSAARVAKVPRGVRR